MRWATKIKFLCFNLLTEIPVRLQRPGDKFLDAIGGIRRNYSDTCCRGGQAIGKTRQAAGSVVRRAVRSPMNAAL
jgi:hypothetical protein